LKHFIDPFFEVLALIQGLLHI